MATMPSAPKKTRRVTAQWTSQAPETRGSASPPLKREMPALLKALMEKKALENAVASRLEQSARPKQEQADGPEDLNADAPGG